MAQPISAAPSYAALLQAATDQKTIILANGGSSPEAHAACAAYQALLKTCCEEVGQPSPF